MRHVYTLPETCVLLVLAAACTWGGVRGKALLIEAPHRIKPGNLVLGIVNGDTQRFETIVNGKVIDARFSPDATGIVYGKDKNIFVMNLAERTSRRIGSYTTDFTYFNWCRNDTIYFSDGESTKRMSEIFRLDIKTGRKQRVHKGFRGRTTVSLDGTRAAWVIPPVCAFIGGKQFRYTGGCGGAISPSGKYLTSNLTTSHRLMGIFLFTGEGPSAQAVKTIPGPPKRHINGFFFGRTDEWVCFVAENKKQSTSYILYWRTGEFMQIGEEGKYCIKDFFDETDDIPSGAVLEKITICKDGISNTPLGHAYVNVGMKKRIKVVGFFRKGKELFTPALRKDISWKTSGPGIKTTAGAMTGTSASGRIRVEATYRGKRDTCTVTVLPRLSGKGFRGEYFRDATFTDKAFSRIDPFINFTWGGRRSPDKSIDGRKPWSVRWTGTIDVQVPGEYTFYFLQGEGNDGWLRNKDRTWARDKKGRKVSLYGVWIDGKNIFTRGKKGNYPWDRPQKSTPIPLAKGLHHIRVETIDVSSHPVVARLWWSGPPIEKSLLGAPHVYSGEETNKK